VEVVNDDAKVEIPSRLCRRWSADHIDQPLFKSPDVYRTGIERQDYGKTTKGGELAKTKGDSKSKTPIKPKVK
jgi:hypothetical protein